MGKRFRPWKIGQTLLLPPSVQDFVPKEHLSRFPVALVRGSLDLAAVTASYTSHLGQPPFDPRMLAAAPEWLQTSTNASPRLRQPRQRSKPRLRQGPAKSDASR